MNVKPKLMGHFSRTLNPKKRTLLQGQKENTELGYQMEGKKQTNIEQIQA